jgi:RNA polymerase sigma-70 factor, ECF subfamily
LSSEADHNRIHQELTNRVIHGDLQALAELFETYRPRLRRIVAFRIDPRLAARVDVEDVLQESYLNAQERLRHVLRDSAGGLFVWLRLIVQQTIADVHRRHLGAKARDAGRERAIPFSSDRTRTSFALSSCFLGHLTSPSQALLRKELTEKLNAALDSMGDLDREVLVLRHFEELSNHEVACMLELSDQAASARYVRALERLSHVLEAIPER